MSLSRRGFLRTGAALPVAVATGGTGAVAGAAAEAVTSGAGLAAALTAAERKARAAMALAKHGFPVHAVVSLFGTKDFPCRGFDEYNKEPLRALMGEQGFRRYSWDQKQGAGTINFYRELQIITALRDIPRDVPLKDMLSADMFRDFLADPASKRGSTDIRPYTLQDIGEYQANEFVHLLDDCCDENTTVNDLDQKAAEYLMNLSRHFLISPEDFGASPVQQQDASWALRNAMKFLADRVDSPALVDMARVMGDAHDSLMQKVHYERRPKTRGAGAESGSGDNESGTGAKGANGVRSEDDARPEAQPKDCKAEAQPSTKPPFAVSVMRKGAGEYVVDPQVASKVLKVDWWQYAQEIDPADSKPQDIEMRAGGLMVAFHNTKVIEHLERAAQKNGKNGNGWFRISLPNRRVGVDLHNPAPEPEV